jgi:hypothetical protein
MKRAEKDTETSTNKRKSARKNCNTNTLARELAQQKTYGKKNDPYPVETKLPSSEEGTENTSEVKSSESSEDEEEETETASSAAVAPAQKQGPNVKRLNIKRIFGGMTGGTSHPRRTGRQHPVFQEMRRLQKTTDFLIRKAPFGRLVREVALEYFHGKSDLRFHSTAILAL